MRKIAARLRQFHCFAAIVFDVGNGVYLVLFLYRSYTHAPKAHNFCWLLLLLLLKCGANTYKSLHRAHIYCIIVCSRSRPFHFVGLRVRGESELRYWCLRSLCCRKHTDWFLHTLCCWGTETPSSWHSTVATSVHEYHFQCYFILFIFLFWISYGLRNFWKQYDVYEADRVNFGGVFKISVSFLGGDKGRKNHLGV